MASKFSDARATTIDATGAMTDAAEAGTLYDRIARLYNITFLFNGYSRSIEKYLRDHPLPLEEGARILDAGCGTGLLTRALLRSLEHSAHIASFDLSASSLHTARRNIKETLRQESVKSHEHSVSLAQANLLVLPFADKTFDFVVTSGALEYVSLDAGLKELARVLRPRGFFLHLPVHPSPATKLLEILFRFKAHPPREITSNTNRYFFILDRHRFPALEPIGWTKTAILAQKRG